jgi:hypothetical protein
MIKILLIGGSILAVVVIGLVILVASQAPAWPLRNNGTEKYDKVVNKMYYNQ